MNRLGNPFPEVGVDMTLEQIIKAVKPKKQETVKSKEITTISKN